jgi:hypothetical protein
MDDWCGARCERVAPSPDKKGTGDRKQIHILSCNASSRRRVRACMQCLDENSTRWVGNTIPEPRIEAPGLCRYGGKGPKKTGKWIMKRHLC